VAALGAGVTRFAVGDRVASNGEHAVLNHGLGQEQRAGARQIARRRLGPKTGGHSLKEARLTGDVVDIDVQSAL